MRYCASPSHRRSQRVRALEPRYKHKQVIAVRSDLGMSTGKLAVQVAHASVTSLQRARREKKEWADAWLAEGQKKVVVVVADERELRELQRKAAEVGLPGELVQDTGLTELPPSTITALGVGPAPSELVDKVTGKLRLL